MSDPRNDPGRKPLEEAGITERAGASSETSPYMPVGNLDPLAGWGRPRRRYPWVILLGSVVVVAAGGFFSARFLGWAGADTSSAEVPRPVTYKVQSKNGETSDSEVVIDVVPDLVADGEPETPSEQVVGFIENLPPAKDPRGLREQEIQEAARRLRLEAILWGPNPSASINKQTVEVGGLVKVPAGTEHGPVDFGVVSITDNTVTLVAEDPQLDLEVEIELRIE